MTPDPRRELLALRADGAGYRLAVPAGATSRVDAASPGAARVVVTCSELPLVTTSTTVDSPLATAELQVSGELGRMLAARRGRSPSLDVHTQHAVAVEGSDEAVLADVSWGEVDRHRSLVLVARADGRRLVTLEVAHPERAGEHVHRIAGCIVDSLVIDPATDVGDGRLVERYRELEPGRPFD